MFLKIPVEMPKVAAESSKKQTNYILDYLTLFYADLKAFLSRHYCKNCCIVLSTFITKSCDDGAGKNDEMMLPAGRSSSVTYRNGRE